VQQKRSLARDITEAVVNNFKVASEDVTVTIIKQPPENFAEASRLLCDPK